MNIPAVIETLNQLVWYKQYAVITVSEIIIFPILMVDVNISQSLIWEYIELTGVIV